MDRLRGLRSDIGETLVETLVALVILSLAAVAILAGVEMSTRASDMHRKQTTGGAYVRNYAEAIEQYLSTPGADHYVPCAAAGTYTPTLVGFTVPPGYTWQQAQAKPLDGVGVEGTCPGGDQGVQKVQLTLSSGDDRAAETLTVILRRACEGTTCHPTP